MASSFALMASLSERAFTSALSMRAVVKEESPLAGMVMKMEVTVSAKMSMLLACSALPSASSSFFMKSSRSFVGIST